MRPVERRRLDVMLVVARALVLVASAILARRAYHWEAVIFQPINGLPAGLRPFLWALNQYAAHLPLDLIGGAALGVTIASAANLLLGVPTPLPAEDIRAGPPRSDSSDP